MAKFALVVFKHGMRRNANNKAGLIIATIKRTDRESFNTKVYKKDLDFLINFLVGFIVDPPIDLCEHYNKLFYKIAFQWVLGHLV